MFQAKELAKQNMKETKGTEEAATSTAEIEKDRGKAAAKTVETAHRTAAEAEKWKHAEHKAKHKTEEKYKALGSFIQNDVRYRKYNIEDIEYATERFAKSNKIGEGGYGPVYRGCLDHTPVAIKILRPDAAQGMKQFNQEVCTIFSLFPSINYTQLICNLISVHLIRIVVKNIACSPIRYISLH